MIFQVMIGDFHDFPGDDGWFSIKFSISLDLGSRRYPRAAGEGPEIWQKEGAKRGRVVFLPTWICWYMYWLLMIII